MRVNRDFNYQLIQGCNEHIRLTYMHVMSVKVSDFQLIRTVRALLKNSKDYTGATAYYFQVAPCSHYCLDRSAVSPQLGDI